MHSPATPSYPFELVVADYFTLVRFNYLIYTERCTGWVTVSKAPATGSTASSLINDLPPEWVQLAEDIIESVQSNEVYKN